MAKAAAAKTIKVPQDIEYRVIGNAFGLLIAVGGLLAGAMVSERSLEYWRDDIVLLALLVIMGFRLYRSFMTTMTVYQNVPPPSPHPAHGAPPPRESVQPDQAAMAQLPEMPPTPPGYTPEQVVEEVVKRIEAQKAEQAKKSKPKD